MSMTCGEATMQLLARYGISTVFGIPGVHTLEMCRGLSDDGGPGTLRHVRARTKGSGQRAIAQTSIGCRLFVGCWGAVTGLRHRSNDSSSLRVKRHQKCSGGGQSVTTACQ